MRVRRMRGADAGFLYAENAEQSMTTPVLVLLRPEGRDGAAARALTVEDLRAHVEARLDLLPSFRRRVERVPLGIGHPVLVDDPDFDLGYHLRHVSLDDASEAGLHTWVAEQQEVRLDRRHPLWRMVLVDGLHDGRQALLLLWSHAIADGTACRTTLRRLLTDVDPEEAAAVRAAEPFRPEPVRRRAILAAALAELGPSLLLLVRRVLGLVRRGRAVAARREAAAVRVPEAADTPVTRLNDAWSGRRRVAAATVPLADVVRVKAAAGATVNDVFLAMAAGAVREELRRTGDLPEAPLTVDIPVSTEPSRPRGSPERQWGNHFTNHVSSLATDVDDPVARLRAIGAAAREARAQLDLLGPTALADVLDVIPGAAAERGARWLSAQKREHAPERAEHSVLLSNVRGASAPFRFSSAAGPVAVERTQVFGMPFEGAGLSLVGWTYGDHVELTAMSDPEAVPDPAAVLDGMVAALGELDRALGAGREEVADATPQR